MAELKDKAYWDKEKAEKIMGIRMSQAVEATFQRWLITRTYWNEKKEEFLKEVDETYELFMRRK
jgi:hypothetical protein